MIRIDLIYNDDTAQLQRMRAVLMDVFRDLGIAPHWHEWKIGDISSPFYVKGHPALTVFINGAVLKADQSAQKSSGLAMPLIAPQAFPSKEQFILTLKKRQHWGRLKPKLFSRYLYLACVFPFWLLTILPSFDCPFCWPGYANKGSGEEIGMMGIGYFMAYFFPFILFTLSVALMAFLYRSLVKQEFGPFFLAVVAGFASLSSKVMSYNATLEVAGIILFLLAVVLHYQERKENDPSKCRGCLALLKEEIKL